MDKNSVIFFIQYLHLLRVKIVSCFKFIFLKILLIAKYKNWVSLFDVNNGIFYITVTRYYCYCSIIDYIKKNAL